MADPYAGLTDAQARDALRPVLEAYLLDKKGPQEAARVDRYLDKYAGMEKQMLEKLSPKYGKPAAGSSSNSEGNPNRDRLVAFYNHYGLTQKLPLVDSNLAKFTGREENLFAQLVAKYGPEPGSGTGAAAPARSRNSSQAQTASSSAAGSAAPNPHRDRLVAFYNHYGLTQKLPLVDSNLAKFTGREENLFAQLVAKYGPEPAAATASARSESSQQAQSAQPQQQSAIPSGRPPTSAPAEEEASAYRSRVERVYQKYCPEKIANLDQVMEKYKGQENVLLQALVQKYGPEPEPLANEQSQPLQVAPVTKAPSQTLPPAAPVATIIEPQRTTSADHAVAAAPQQAGSDGGAQMQQPSRSQSGSAAAAVGAPIQQEQSQQQQQRSASIKSAVAAVPQQPSRSQSQQSGVAAAPADAASIQQQQSGQQSASDAGAAPNQQQQPPSGAVTAKPSRSQSQQSGAATAVPAGGSRSGSAPAVASETQQDPESAAAPVSGDAAASAGRFAVSSDATAAAVSTNVAQIDATNNTSAAPIRPSEALDRNEEGGSSAENKQQQPRSTSQLSHSHSEQPRTSSQQRQHAPEGNIGTAAAVYNHEERSQSGQPEPSNALRVLSTVADQAVHGSPPALAQKIDGGSRNASAGQQQEPPLNSVAPPRGGVRFATIPTGNNLPEAIASTSSTVPANTSPLPYRDRLVRFYEYHGLHDRMRYVDGNLNAFRGREEKMMQQLVKKWGPEPPVPRHLAEKLQSNRNNQDNKEPAGSPRNKAATADLALSMPLQHAEQQQRVLILGDYIAQHQRLGTKELAQRLSVLSGKGTSSAQEKKSTPLIPPGVFGSSAASASKSKSTSVVVDPLGIDGDGEESRKYDDNTHTTNRARSASTPPIQYSFKARLKRLFMTYGDPVRIADIDTLLSRYRRQRPQSSTEPAGHEHSSGEGGSNQDDDAAVYDTDALEAYFAALTQHYESQKNKTKSEPPKYVKKAQTITVSSSNPSSSASWSSSHDRSLPMPAVSTRSNRNIRNSRMSNLEPLGMSENLQSLSSFSPDARVGDGAIIMVSSTETPPVYVSPPRAAHQQQPQNRSAPDPNFYPSVSNDQSQHPLNLSVTPKTFTCVEMKMTKSEEEQKQMSASAGRTAGRPTSSSYTSLSSPYPSIQEYSSTFAAANIDGSSSNNNRSRKNSVNPCLDQLVVVPQMTNTRSDRNSSPTRAASTVANVSTTHQKVTSFQGPTHETSSTPTAHQFYRVMQPNGGVNQQQQHAPHQYHHPSKVGFSSNNSNFHGSVRNHAYYTDQTSPSSSHHSVVPPPAAAAVPTPVVPAHRRGVERLMVGVRPTPPTPNAPAPAAIAASSSLQQDGEGVKLSTSQTAAPDNGLNRSTTNINNPPSDVNPSAAAPPGEADGGARITTVDVDPLGVTTTGDSNGDGSGSPTRSRRWGDNASSTAGLERGYMVADEQRNTAAAAAAPTEGSSSASTAAAFETSGVYNNRTHTNDNAKYHRPPAPPAQHEITSGAAVITPAQLLQLQQQDEQQRLLLASASAAAAAALSPRLIQHPYAPPVAKQPQPHLHDHQQHPQQSSRSESVEMASTHFPSGHPPSEIIIGRDSRVVVGGGGGSLASNSLLIHPTEPTELQLQQHDPAPQPEHYMDELIQRHIAPWHPGAERGGPPLVVSQRTNSSNFYKASPPRRSASGGGVEGPPTDATAASEDARGSVMNNGNDSAQCGGFFASTPDQIALQAYHDRQHHFEQQQQSQHALIQKAGHRSISSPPVLPTPRSSSASAAASSSSSYGGGGGGSGGGDLHNYNYKRATVGHRQSSHAGRIGVRSSSVSKMLYHDAAEKHYLEDHFKRLGKNVSIL